MVTNWKPRRARTGRGRSRCRRPASTRASRPAPGPRRRRRRSATRRRRPRPGRSGRAAAARTRRRTPARSTATGRTIIASKRAQPDVPAEPLDVADDEVRRCRGRAPSRRTGRRSAPSPKPPSASTLLNITRIATKSTPVITNDADGHDHERRAVGPATTRIHIAARIANARTSPVSRARAAQPPWTTTLRSASRSTAAQASSSTAPQPRLEGRARRARPRPARWPSQMSIGTWTNADQGSASDDAAERLGEQHQRHDEAREEHREHRRQGEHAALVEEPERARRDQHPDREADHDAERHRDQEGERRSAGSSGSAGRTGSAPMIVGAMPRVSRWYVARPRSPARNQPRKLTGR